MTQKKTPNQPEDSSSTSSSNSPLEGYEEFDINVIPTVREVDNSLFYDETITTDGQTPEYTEEYGDDEGEEPSDGGEILTLEDCEALSYTVWNMPGMFLGDHLERTEEQVKPFARQLFVYCTKKGIDPNDYLFDEFGLVVATVAIGGGLVRDHKSYKKDKKAYIKEKKSGFDSTTGSAEDYSPVEKKESEYDSASGNNLPEEDEDMITIE